MTGKNRQGYTLIELLVVLGVLAMAVGALTMFLTSIFKGTNKANQTAEVKQNGQVVLDSLERQIRGAVDAEEIGLTNDLIKLTRDAAEPLYIKCLDEGVGKNARIGMAQVSDSELDPITKRPGDDKFLSVSNDDPKTGVTVENCRINVFEATTSQSGLPIPAVVSISFVVKKESARADFTAFSQFETTISLRRY